jgi:hypothetical protein
MAVRKRHRTAASIRDAQRLVFQNGCLTACGGAGGRVGCVGRSPKGGTIDELNFTPDPNRSRSFGRQMRKSASVRRRPSPSYAALRPRTICPIPLIILQTWAQLSKSHRACNMRNAVSATAGSLALLSGADISAQSGSRPDDALTLKLQIKRTRNHEHKRSRHNFRHGCFRTRT